MKLKKIISMIVSSALAAGILSGGVMLELKAADVNVDEVKDIEMVKHINENGEEEYALLLHGHSIIIKWGNTSAENTVIYDDKNHDGKIDSGDEILDIKTLANTVGITGIYGKPDASTGFGCSDIVIYGVGGFDSNYTTHEGDVLITYQGGWLKGIVGSTGECDQTGDFILDASSGPQNGEIGFIEGAGAGNWTGDIMMMLSGEVTYEEVYGGSKSAETIVTGNVLIQSHDKYSYSSYFGNSAYNPNSGGVYAGGKNTTIEGDFEFRIADGRNCIIHDLDSSMAAITGNVIYNLGDTEIYGEVKSNPDNGQTIITASSIGTEDNGIIYLGEGEVIDPIDTAIEVNKIKIEPTIKKIGTVIVKPSSTDVVLTGAEYYVGSNLLENTGFVLNDQNEIVIGRENENVMEITFETGTDTELEAQLVVKGDTVTLPEAPNRSGYEFAGWSDGTTTYAPSSDYTVPDTDVTLTAVWKAASSSSSSSSTSSALKPSNGFVNKKGETYFYEKGKPVQNGFVVVNNKDKLVETIKPNNMQELSDSDYKAYYAKPDGTVAKAEWIVLDKNGKLIDTLPLGEFKKQYGNEYKVYLADANGKLIRSWKDTENNWYYFNADFSAKYEYWQAHYEDWYYFDNYSYLRNTWHATDNGRWYYFDAEGKMVRNQWVDGCWINELGIYWSPIYSDPEFIANYK
ncbi:InlB B-repeat-containing protein [Dielma fastidiosa]|uniref:InlB B-repeat-containing protein n=1 Tax=Dielma fastidiosa TaxID=1034346 RepID=UPI0035645921